VDRNRHRGLRGIRIIAATALIISIAMVVSVTGSAAQTSDAGELTRVDIAYPAISPSVYPLWVTKDIGAFEKCGVDAHLIFVEGSQRGSATLISGSTPFAMLPGPNILDPAAQGADVVALMSMGERLTDVIVGGEGITSPEALKGGAVAANQAGGETDFAVRHALEAMGFVPDTDVSVVAVGGESTRVAALEAGSVQAAIMDVSLVPAMEAQGFTVVYSFMDSDLPYQRPALVTTRSYMAENPDIVDCVVRAMLEGVAYYKNHRDEAISIAAKYSMTTQLAPIAFAYDLYAPALPYVPKLSSEAFETVQSWSTDEAVKALDPTTLYDNSLLEALEESGYTKEIEGS
jgi:NitT/TauT family transport system substrate-binding protein